MPERVVYMDYNATTPLHPEVKKALVEGFEIFGNASSMHTLGRQAHEKIEKARKIVADFLGAYPEEIVFTGGGSESNNTVLQMIDCGSATCRCMSKGRLGLVTTQIEHPSVLNVAQYMENKGISVEYLPVDPTGKVDMEAYRRALVKNPALVSIMMANNEIGTVQDIRTLARMAKEQGALFHTDAVQAVGKLPISVHDLGIDYLSFSAHKLYGPKGVGALYIKKGTRITPLLHGGGQEKKKRAGTLNVPAIVGMGEAFRLAAEEMEEDARRQTVLRDRLIQGILQIPDTRLNGTPPNAFQTT